MIKVAISFLMFAIFFVAGLCSLDAYKMIVMIAISIASILACEHFLDIECEKYNEEKQKKIKKGEKYG